MFYGAAITSGVDILLLSSLVDYWIHPGGPRREHGHYYIPALFFTPNSRLLPLLQAIEGATPPLVLTADLFGFHYTPIVRCYTHPFLLLFTCHLSAMPLPFIVPINAYLSPFFLCNATTDQAGVDGLPPLTHVKVVQRVGPAHGPAHSHTHPAQSLCHPVVQEAHHQLHLHLHLRYGCPSQQAVAAAQPAA